MLGAIVGDIVGSPYEFDFHNIKTTEFPLFSELSYFTDDTVMTLAVAEALMEALPSRGAPAVDETVEAALIKAMQGFAQRFPRFNGLGGYGVRFVSWLSTPNPKPYGSFGNGAAMRVSPAGWAYDTLEEVERCAKLTAQVSHNHPEGIKGAQATAGAILLARQGKDKAEIKRYVQEHHGYDLSRTLDEIRPNYHHVESCQETVPEAITAFLEADGFEDCLRKAVSLGGDSDTLTAIAASIAEAAWGLPEDIASMARAKLHPFLQDVLDRWEVWRG